MTKYYVMKVRGTWLGENDFAISAQGLESAYCVGPNLDSGMAITRKQYEAVRYTRRVKLEVEELGGLGHAAFYFVGLSTKADRLYKRAVSSLIDAEASCPAIDPTVWILTNSSGKEVYDTFDANTVLDVLEAAGI